MQVQRGGSIEIPLRGVSRSGAQLGFLIRSRPVLGTLSEVRSIDRGSAVIVYTHNTDLGAGIDRFRYAVQAPGTGVSTPAEITIHIVDRPPHFTAPREVEFPTIAAGRTRTKIVTLRNQGGGIISGRMELPEPWKFTDGDGSYRLGEDGSTDIAITFAPLREGHFAGAATFSHSGTEQINLSGNAFPTIETSPSRIELSAGGGALVRFGTITVTNRTDDPQIVELSAPEQLQVPETIRLAPRESKEVSIQTAEEFLGSADVAIALRGDGLETSLPVRIFAAPARLEIADTGSEIALGEITEGRTRRATISLVNRGGSDAALVALLPEGFTIQPNPVGETLPPGETRQFEITFTPLAPGPLDETLQIADASGSAVNWTITGSVAADPRAAQGGTAGIHRPRPDAATPAEGTPGAVSRPAATIRRPTGVYPAVEEIRITNRTPNTIEMEWDNPALEIARYDVLSRRLDFSPDGDVLVKWDPVKNATLQIGQLSTTARVEGLRPGEQITFGLIGYDSQGRATQPSIPFTINSVYVAPFRIPWMWVGVAFMAFCFVIVVRERRKRRRALDAIVNEMPHRR